MEIPRPEYPRPQFVRPDWLCLNGEWQFEIDAGDSGEVTRHRGGFTPFTCDLSGVAQPGETVTLVVRARDDHRLPQPRGKQSRRYANYHDFYTRTTGIGQTVWMEPVPEVALQRPRLTPDVANSLIRLEQPITGDRPGLQLWATLLDADGVVSTVSCTANVDFAPCLDLLIPDERRRLWSPGDPHLYDLEIELIDSDGTTVDRATSYAGLRSVAIDGHAIRINGEVVFQRLVLDQGHNPDGIIRT